MFMAATSIGGWSRRMRRRAWLGYVAWALLLTVAGCGPKPVTAPLPSAAPRFADFMFPAAPSGTASQDVLDAHTRAWQLLQAGNTRAAEREFAEIVKTTPTFYPAEAGWGYSLLARKDPQGAIAHFDKALTGNAGYAPALAGKGDALLSLGRTAAALDAFQAALAADPSLTALGSRVDVLKFRLAQENIARARKAADAGKFDEARREYLAAIAASPESAFLYRELAIVERRSGDTEAAIAHAEQAAKLDPTDVRALTMIAEIYEANKDWSRAADAYAAAAAVDGSETANAKVEEMHAKAAFESMPDEYRSIGSSPGVTRAQLAALLAVRLEALLHGARSSTPVLLTDTRGNWASPWILTVARAGVMEPFPNHTFQPNTIVRRGDLARAVSRVLTLIAAQDPRLAGRWRDAHPVFSDVAPSHLDYAAAARAVGAGVMAPLEENAFELTRPVTGPEALDAVSRLEALARK
jgi:tetratricopeptide (TPR) repeat protein